MKVDILTLFPEMFKGVFSESMLKIAQRKKKISINVRNLRDWTDSAHKTADDKPYGGGPGMVMKIEPIYSALAGLLGKNKVNKIKNKKISDKKVSIILTTPKGKQFNQKMAKKFSKQKRLIFLCGHYEGVDERARFLATDEVSVGDYVMTGGELAAMVMVDAVTRLIPGVLGDRASLKQESFDNNLLEYPQYTRPREFKGMKVPEILLTGDHGAIAEWRKKASLKITNKVRRDLLWKKKRSWKKSI